MTDQLSINDAFWRFIDTTHVVGAGGKDAYKRMLERVASQMAADHGDGAVADVFSDIAAQYEAS